MSFAVLNFSFSWHFYFSSFSFWLHLQCYLLHPLYPWPPSGCLMQSYSIIPIAHLIWIILENDASPTTEFLLAFFTNLDRRGLNQKQIMTNYLDHFFWDTPLASTWWQYYEAVVHPTLGSQGPPFLLPSLQPELVQHHQSTINISSCLASRAYQSILREYILIYLGGGSCQGQHFPVDVHRGEISYPHMAHGCRAGVSKLVRVCLHY